MRCARRRGSRRRQGGLAANGNGTIRSAAATSWSKPCLLCPDATV